MRILILAGWLLLVPLFFAYHWGPGQTHLTLDAASNKIKEAEKLAAAEDYSAALSAYDEALKLLPIDSKESIRRVRLERCKVALMAHKLPEAHADLQSLVDEMQEDPATSAALLAQARSAQAHAQYYMTWLMRLEGLSREVWEPEIEAARSTYKYLAEQSLQLEDAASIKKHQEDLESAVRLARMDLAELQGLPLPCQCKCCKSGKCNSRGKQAKNKPEKQDIRSAGAGADPNVGGR